MNYHRELVNVCHETGRTDGQVTEADKLKTLETHNSDGKVSLAIGLLITASFTATESDSGDCEPFDLWQVIDRVTIKLRNLGMWCNNVPGLQLFELMYTMRGWIPDRFYVTGISTAAGDTAKVVYLPIMFAPGPFWGHWRNLEGAIPLSEFKEAAKISVKTEWSIGADWSVNSSGVTLDMDLIVVHSDELPEPIGQRFVVQDCNENTELLDIDSTIPGGTRIRHIFVSDDGDSGFDASGVTAASLTLDGVNIWHGVNGDDLHRMHELFTHQHEANYTAYVGASDAPEVFTVLSGAEVFAEDCPLVERSAKLANANGTHSGNYYINQLLQWRPPQNVADKIKRDCRVAEVDIQRAKAEENATRYEIVSSTPERVPMTILPPSRFRAYSPALLPVSEL